MLLLLKHGVRSATTRAAALVLLLLLDHSAETMTRSNSSSNNSICTAAAAAGIQRWQCSSSIPAAAAHIRGRDCSPRLTQFAVFPYPPPSALPSLLPRSCRSFPRKLQEGQAAG
ncbi:hypothetical protein B0H34DRAFT_252902 [Crassisporium funariophilum]|nr:hypothetical protein B0H34DRAFT_252902 [Crassisporium funariophilum]